MSAVANDIDEVLPKLKPVMLGQLVFSVPACEVIIVRSTFSDSDEEALEPERGTLDKELRSAFIDVDQINAFS